MSLAAGWRGVWGGYWLYPRSRSQVLAPEPPIQSQASNSVVKLLICRITAPADLIGKLNVLRVEWDATNVRYWHLASFRCGAEIRSLLNRSGHRGEFYEYTA